jgi:hypothetical protein
LLQSTASNIVIFTLLNAKVPIVSNKCACLSLSSLLRNCHT